MSRKTAKFIFIAAIVCGALISGIGTSGGPQWLSFLGMAIMCGGLMVQLFYYRCPHCRAYLGRNPGEYCPSCGKKLDEK